MIDPSTLKMVGKIPTARPESHMLAITRDGRRGYTRTWAREAFPCWTSENVIQGRCYSRRIKNSAHRPFRRRQLRLYRRPIPAATRRHRHRNQQAEKLRQFLCLPRVMARASRLTDAGWSWRSRGKQVAVVDLGSMKVAHTIDVPAAPQEVLISPDGEPRM